MQTLWDASTRDAVLRRFESLSPSADARWGRMNCEQMLEHIVEGMRMGIGEIESRPRKMIVRYWPLNWLFLNFLPWPKGSPGPREIMVPRAPKRTWDANLAELRRALDDFATRTAQRDWPPHPLFGAMSSRAWGRLGYRHADHHLRQFGA